MLKKMVRHTQLGLFILALFVLACSLYFQYALAFEPCPLCIMQRVMMGVLMILFFMGIFLWKKKSILSLLLVELFFSFFGLYFALRQVWLQSLPMEDTGVCMPGFDLLIRYLPPREIIQALFWGERSCGEATWSGLGLSMAVWSSFCFSAIILILLGVIIRTTRNCKP